MRTSIFLAGCVIAHAINPSQFESQACGIIASAFLISDIVMFAYKTLKQPKN